MTLCHVLWILFLEPLRSHLIRTGDLKTSVDVCTMCIVQCQVIVDNMCRFEHKKKRFLQQQVLHYVWLCSVVLYIVFALLLEVKLRFRLLKVFKNVLHGFCEIQVVWSVSFVSSCFGFLQVVVGS